MNTRIRNAIEQLPAIFKILMVIGVIAFISFLFPNHVQFTYEFEKGQSWRYNDLNAPFDFAIRKPAKNIEQERQAVLDNFSPHYEVQFDREKESKRLFNEEFRSQLEQDDSANQFPDVARNPKKYQNYGLAFLDRLFKRGIVQLASSHSSEGRDFVIVVQRGNLQEQRTLSNLLNEEAAKEQLSDSLPYSRLREPEFLFPILENVIQPNIVYSDSLSQQFKSRELANLSTSSGMVRKGELIIQRDGVITDEAYQKLVSLKEQYQVEVSAQRSIYGVLFGYILLTSLIIGVYLMYLQLYAKEIYASFWKLLFVFLWIVVYSYLVYVVESVDVLSAYLIPFCIVPIVIKTFYDARLALFTHIVVVLIASFLSSLGYEFTFLHILAGIVVLLSDVDTRDWSRFFYSILYIFLAYGLAYLGLSLIKEGKISTIDWNVYTWIFINVFLTLLAYPLIPLLERFFGFTSSISLMELSDMNRPLLRELALKAPGTLQHSLQVANLAEGAAQRIGANPLLVKVAALYHDIGKTSKPEFFIENQSGKNPHDEISFLDSAKIIIGHVEEGVAMAKKHRLPNVLIDFIRKHHGTTRTEFFYRSYIKENPGTEFDEDLFRYPGPRPVTKEETILMMADSIEAACKSLKNPSEKELNDFIDKIISGKITQGQLEDSQMSFQELEECKQVFKQIMKSVHHVRIEYPEEKKKS